MSPLNKIINTLNRKIEGKDPTTIKILEILQNIVCAGNKNYSLIEILFTLNSQFLENTIHNKNELDKDAERIMNLAKEKEIDIPQLEILLKDKIFSKIIEESLENNLDPTEIMEIATHGENEKCFENLKINKIFNTCLGKDEKFKTTLELSEFIFNETKNNMILPIDLSDENFTILLSYLRDKNLFNKIFQTKAYQNFFFGLLDKRIDVQEILENIYRLNIVYEHKQTIFSTPINALKSQPRTFNPNLTEILTPKNPPIEQLPHCSYNTENYETTIPEQTFYEMQQTTFTTPNTHWPQLQNTQKHKQIQMQQTQNHYTQETHKIEKGQPHLNQNQIIQGQNETPYFTPMLSNQNQPPYSTPLFPNQNQQPYPMHYRHSNLSNNSQPPHFRTNPYESTFLAQVKPYSLPEIIKIIPEFDGNPSKLSSFIAGCNSARNLIPYDIDAELAKLIHIKLSGTPKEIVEDKKFNSLKDILNYFQKIYGDTQNYYQLSGQLANIKQSQNESAISFALRLKSKARAVKHAAIQENKYFTNFEYSLNKDLKDFFYTGLKTEIRLHLTSSLHKPLEEIIDDAVLIEKNLTGKENTLNTRIHKIDTQNLITCQFCDKVGHTSKNCRLVKSNTDKKQEVKCQHCDKIGHTSKTCYAIIKPYSEKEKPDPREKCQYCEKPGHTSKTCRQIGNNTNNNNPAVPKTITCNYCKKPGHEIKDCRKRKYNNERREHEKMNQGNGTQSLQIGAVQETVSQQ